MTWIRHCYTVVVFTDCHNDTSATCSTPQFLRLRVARRVNIAYKNRMCFPGSRVVVDGWLLSPILYSFVSYSSLWRLNGYRNNGVQHVAGRWRHHLKVNYELNYALSSISADMLKTCFRCNNETNFTWIRLATPAYTAWVLIQLTRTFVFVWWFNTVYT